MSLSVAGSSQNPERQPVLGFNGQPLPVIGLREYLDLTASGDGESESDVYFAVEGRRKDLKYENRIVSKFDLNEMHYGIATYPVRQGLLEQEVSSEDEILNYQTSIHRHQDGDYASAESKVQINTKDRDLAKEVHTEIRNELKAGKSIQDILKSIASNHKYDALKITYQIERTEGELKGLTIPFKALSLKNAGSAILGWFASALSKKTTIPTLTIAEAIERLQEMEDAKPGETQDICFAVDYESMSSLSEESNDDEVTAAIQYPDCPIPPYMDMLITTLLNNEGSLATRGIRLGLDGDKSEPLSKQETNAYEMSLMLQDGFMANVVILSGNRNLAKEIHNTVFQKLNSGEPHGKVLNWFLNESSYSKKMGEGNPVFEMQGLLTKER